MTKRSTVPAAAVAFAFALVFGVLLAKCQDAKTTGNNSPAVTGSNNKVAVDSKPAEPKEVPLSEADADKFLLAVERANHIQDLIRVAYNDWTREPAIAAMFKDKDEKDAALQKLAGEILKKMSLDDGKHQIDATTPHPKAVLRQEAKK
jgi:hypothetical protein